MADLRERLEHRAERGDHRGVEAIVEGAMSELVQRDTPPTQRRIASRLAVACLAIAALIGAVMWVRSSDDRDGARLTTSSPSSSVISTSTSLPTTTSTASAPPTQRPSGLPPLAVGIIDHDQSLVLVDTTNGQVVRSLARSIDADSQLSDAHLSQDGFVYFQQNYPGDIGADLRRVSVDTPGEPEVIIRNGGGYNLSSDGQRVAYVPYVYTPSDPTPASVVVHELRTGADKSWSVDPNAQPRVFINGLAWSPDNRTLAVGVVSYDQSTILGGGTALLDVSSAPGRLREPTMSELRPQLWLDEHRLVFNEAQCCPTNAIVLRVHDIQTGKDTDLINATPVEPPTYISTVSLDDSGSWLLLAGMKSEADWTPYTAVFGPLDGHAELTELADLGLFGGDW